MNSLEFNRIFGAVLLAFLVIIGINMLGDALVVPHELEKQAYVVAGVEVAAEEETVVAEAAPEPSLQELLAGASISDGQRQFRKCAACHTTDDGGGNRIGPNLFAISGAAVAGKDGFNYSGALADLGGIWDDERLDTWLESPRSFAPGNKMTFAGIKDAADRADLLAFLKSLTN